jgi:hypothetical protein
LLLPLPLLYLSFDHPQIIGWPILCGFIAKGGLPLLLSLLLLFLIVIPEGDLLLVWRSPKNANQRPIKPT